MKQLRSWHLSVLKVISDPMSALARTSERDCRTRTTNEDCTANESWTRTKYTYDPVGNRTQKVSTLPGYAGGTSSYNANDQLARDTYDNDSNTTASSGVGYVLSLIHI